MAEFFTGIIIGIYITLFSFNCISLISIPWWILIILGIILFISITLIKMYIFITDYKAIADTGIAVSKYIFNRIKNKKTINNE